MEKLYERIDFKNGTVPALNEDNLNAMSKAIAELDSRVIQIAPETLILQLKNIIEILEEAQNFIESAEGNALLSKSYATGGTGTRDGENTDNAKYYNQQSLSYKQEAYEYASQAQNYYMNTSSAANRAGALVTEAEEKLEKATPVANLLATEPGSPLDATMGKLLDEKIAEMQGTGGGGEYYAGTCTTAAGTSSKTVTISGFQLKVGAIVHIKFSYTNTSSTATLNVSSTGAVPMYYKDGTRMYYIPTGVYHSFIYDGTYWRYLGSESSLIGTRSYERYGLKMSESALVPVISGYNPTLGSSSSKMGTIYSNSIGTDSYPTSLIYGDTVYANVLYAKTGIYRTRMLPPLPLLYGHFTIASFHTITIGSSVCQNYVKSLYTGYLNTNGEVNSGGCASPESPQGNNYDIAFIFRVIGYDSSAGKQAVPFVHEFALTTAYTSDGCEDQSSDWYTFKTPCGNKVYFYLSGISIDTCGGIYGEPVLNIIGTTANVHFSEIALMP